MKKGKVPVEANPQTGNICVFACHTFFFLSSKKKKKNRIENLNDHHRAENRVRNPGGSAWCFS